MCKAWALSFLPCLNPFWTRWVWAEGFQPICSWGSHQSQHLLFLAVAPPAGLDRLETEIERERESNNAVGLKGEKLLGEKETQQRCVLSLWLWTVVSEVGRNLLNIVRWLQCDSQWTSTKMLTLVFPTALKTRHETGSVKKEWSALVVNTLSLAPCSTTPPLAHLGFNTVR